MERFVKVMNTFGDNGEHTETEIIRVSDLIKIFKVDGDTGTAIGFVFNDATRRTREDWRYECKTEYARDVLFGEYERQLCD